MNELCSFEDVKSLLGIAAAVAAVGAPCVYWDTEGWIDPATDTGDGLHPNAAGHANIATAMLALLP